ncbi:MAG: hypothetical protein ACOQNV_03265 [Mycoplasmoidaceae bacterium]
MKKNTKIKLALSTAILPLGMLSICAATQSNTQHNNTNPVEYFDVKVNMPGYFPCKVVTDVTQIHNWEEGAPSIVHLYIEDNPTRDVYISDISIKVNGKPQSESDAGQCITYERWEGHNSAYEISVGYSFYQQLDRGNIEITPTLEKSTFQVQNMNEEEVYFTSTEAKLYSTFRTEIYPTHKELRKISSEIPPVVKLGDDVLDQSEYTFKICADGAYAILLINSGIITSKQLSIDVKTQFEPIINQKSLTLLFEDGNTMNILTSIAQCIPKDETKINISLANFAKTVPLFGLEINGIFKQDETGWVELEDAEAEYNENIQMVSLNMNENPNVNIALNVVLRSKELFENDEWTNLYAWRDFAEEKIVNIGSRTEFMKKLYDVNDFVGRTKTVLWDGVEHQVRVTGVNDLYYAPNMHLLTSKGDKALFTFEFVNILTQANGEAYKDRFASSPGVSDAGINCWCYSEGLGLVESHAHHFLNHGDFLDKLDSGFRNGVRWSAQHRITMIDFQDSEHYINSQEWVGSYFFLPTAEQIGAPHEGFKDTPYYSEKQGDDPLEYDDHWETVGITPLYSDFLGSSDPKRDAWDKRIKMDVNGNVHTYWIATPSGSGSGELQKDDTIYITQDGSLSHTDVDKDHCFAPWFCI